MCVPKLDPHPQCSGVGQLCVCLGILGLYSPFILTTDVPGVRLSTQPPAPALGKKLAVLVKESCSLQYTFLRGFPGEF